MNHHDPVQIYDTTLRDGTQAEGFMLSVHAKMRAVRLLDDLGVRYIEGGWPGSNPRDVAFFGAARQVQLRHATLVAFGSTRRAGRPVEEDRNLRALLECGVSAVTIFGKASRRHAERVLRVDPQENLALIYDTIAWMRRWMDEVFFDAEHFFDGYAADPVYALSAVEAAVSAGAHAVVLCDTNGGSLPSAVARAVRDVAREVDCVLGVHAHDDCGLAVANSVAAVEAGASMVQGTINGYGERCGNANLMSVIPTLELKLGRPCLPAGRLEELVRVSRAVDSLAERPPHERAPFVGRSAFAHKAGVHVHAVMRDPASYEHVDPAVVGNERRVLVSDLSGRHNLAAKAKRFGRDLGPDDPRLLEVLRKVKELEHDGWSFEGAGASLDLLFAEACGARPRWFEVHGASVTTRVEGGTHPSSARVALKVAGEIDERTAVGNGPVHALGTALRDLLLHPYPSVAGVRLVDYRVRILDAGAGMAARVRVMVRMTDGTRVWGTCGVSTNVVEASWHAVVDAFEHHLLIRGLAGTRRRAVA